MAAELSTTVEEIKRLQGCINDLISVQALPAVWSGQASPQIVGNLLEVLVRVHGLDFAYARINSWNGTPSFEVIRADQHQTPHRPYDNPNRALEDWLPVALPHTPFAMSNPSGEGSVSVAPFRLGLQDEIGFLLAVSRRDDFPTTTELIVLRVAINQGVIALHESRLLSEQKSVAEELDRRVRERTEELRAVNVALTQEIGERERAQEENRKLALLVENSSDFIAIAALDGQVLFVNRAGQEMVGLDGDEHARATSVIDYSMEEDREHMRNHILPTLQREEHWEGERRFRHFKTGAAILTWQHIFLIKSPDSDRPVMMATISRDISDRRRAEEALHTARGELARVSRVITVGELAASIAHEVNQPLAAIVTGGNACMRWLAVAPPNLDEARAAVSRIVRDGNRASEVIARIRNLVKKTIIEKADLDVNETIQEVVSLVQSEIRKNKVALSTELAADLPSVLGDRVQLQQVVLNLMMNGIEAMSAIADRPRELAITTQRVEIDKVRVSVRDSGIGVAAQDIEWIFNPFCTTKREGMGMGLSISRSIIEAHGGRLWLARNHGAGTTLQFTLPVVRA